MIYVSTRGDAPELGFCDVILSGLAQDGGLYLPKEWPQFDAAFISGLEGLSYEDVAKRIIEPFVEGEISQADLSDIVDRAYDTFSHKAITPLVQNDANEWILELFHGPTLAFKDVAMQLLALLTDHVLAQRGQRVAIVGATSGDTGGAAIDAFKGRANSDIFVLFPDGKVSDVQRWQMTGVQDKNVHALAIDGTFDDCQALVKGMFNHHGFRDEVNLTGVNSINWGRIMAQIVYYFTSSVALGGPKRMPSFCVPTGNFGDIFAGYAAKRMGLPIDRLIIATNSNDILARALETGRYETSAVVATTSPSMDIQVSSNFERLLFEASGRDPQAVVTMMSSLAQSGSFTIPDRALELIRSQFDAGRVSEDEVAGTISEVHTNCGYLLDPHTAIGVAVSRSRQRGQNPMIILGTAHPAKFPDAVYRASNIRPELPARSQDLMRGQERFTLLPNSLDSVEAYIRENTRRDP